MANGHDPVEEWLLKAEHDLVSAAWLAAASPPILDTGIYHCQQAAEKVLKAALAAKQRPLQKTHDLEILLDLLLADFPSLDLLRNYAELLTPYGTAFRYPGNPGPSPEEFAEALDSARKIVAAVRGLLGKQ